MKSRLLSFFAAIIIGAPSVALASEAYSPAKPNSSAVARKHGDPVVSAARKQARATDRALAKRVRKSIAKDHALDQARIVVFAKGGAVTLTGEVADEPQIALAEKRTSAVPGVTSVNNRLTLSEGGS
ncbi:BON domain-containing protein [Burkholderia sp. Bp9031]|uniref:BON domain-containing protein n=1 Tax=Burkholderia sp. Bp9031 TaxID=2184566 RepID=UPI0009EBEC57|nr:MULTISPECIES: BON domain-containing protein [Burkholderia]RQZ19737.1 BON domain-containing protein [Burkholderia sp. Bp9031]